jgi:hypothetical protein
MRKTLFLLFCCFSLAGLTAVGQTPTPSTAPSNGAFASDTHWYLIQNGKGRYLSIATGWIDDNSYLWCNSTTYPGVSDESLWCVVAETTSGESDETATTNYIFYNKAGGTTKHLAVSGSNAAARFKLYTDDEVSQNSSTSEFYDAFYFQNSTYTSDNTYTLITCKGTDHNNWNPHGQGDGHMSLWDADASDDQGNAWKFIDALTAATDLLTAEVKVWTTDKTLGSYDATDVDAYTTAKSTLESNSQDAATIYNAYKALHDARDGKFIYPEADKEYQIVSAYPEFYNQHGVNMALYSSDSNFRWGSLTNAKAFRWTVETTSTTGNFKIKNSDTGTYISAAGSSGGTLGETAAEVTLAFLETPGEFNLKIGSANPFHCNVHGNGANTDGAITVWAGTSGSPSSWKFVELTTDGILAQLKEELSLYSATVIGALNPTGSEAYTKAKEAAEKENATYSDLQTALDALIAAEETTPLVMPAEGHYYQIVSSDSRFAANSQEKYIYSDGTNVMWGNADNSDLNYYWTVTPITTDDETAADETSTTSTIALTALATAQYAYLTESPDDNAKVTLSDEAVPVTLVRKSAIGEVRLDLNGTQHTLHLLGHGSGTGSGSSVIYWSGAYSSSDASAFYIREVDPDTVAKAIGATITTGLGELRNSDADRVEKYLRAFYQKNRTETYLSYVGTGYNRYQPGDDNNETSASLTTCKQHLEALGALTTVDALKSYNDLDAIISECPTVQASVATLTLNLPKAGDFLRIVATNGVGYLSSSNHATQTSRAQFVSAVDNTTTVFFFDGNTLENYSNGYLLADNATNSPMLYYNGVATGSSIKFQADAAGTLCQYNILFSNETRSFNANAAGYTDAAGSDAPSSSPGPGYRFTLEKVDTLDVVVGESQYATFYAPVSVTLPDGLSAYTGTVDDDYFRLTEVSNGTIPAHTGVILQGPAATYRLPIVDNSYQAATVANEEASAADDATTLSGTVATVNATTPTDGAIYTLQKRDEQVGLFPFLKAADSTVDTDVAQADSSDDATTAELKGFKAYLTLNETQAAAVRGLIFGEDTTVTAINAVSAAAPDADALYDLGGRRITTPAARGIYIANGKKVYIP